MRKTIGALTLALGLGLGMNSCTNPKHGHNLKLEQSVSTSDQRTFDMSLKERRIVRDCLEMIGNDYKVPNIVFFEKDYGEDETSVNNIWGGKSPGLCKDNKEYLPEGFDYDRFGHYYLVLLKDIREHEKENEKEKKIHPTRRWHMPAKPMYGTTIHEIGHIYYSLLSSEEKEKVARVFWEVDKTLPSSLVGKPHHGHASFYSFFYWISPEADLDDAVNYSNEQFAETFTYMILGKNFMNHDEGFMKKLRAVQEAMKKFRKK